jgi:hypothetical protein
MISFTIAVKVGGRTRAEMVERDTPEDFTTDDLAHATDLAYELLAHLEREVTRAQKRREGGA